MNSSHFVPKKEFVRNYAFSLSFLCLSTQFPKFKVVHAYIQYFGFQTTDFDTNQTCVVVGGAFLALCRNMNMYPILRVHRDVIMYGKRGVALRHLFGNHCRVGIVVIEQLLGPFGSSARLFRS